jgi:hypothetical protein
MADKPVVSIPITTVIILVTTAVNLTLFLGAQAVMLGSATQKAIEEVETAGFGIRKVEVIGNKITWHSAETVSFFIETGSEEAAQVQIVEHPGGNRRPFFFVREVRPVTTEDGKKGLNIALHAFDALEFRPPGTKPDEPPSVTEQGNLKWALAVIQRGKLNQSPLPVSRWDGPKE